LATSSWNPRLSAPAALLLGLVSATAFQPLGLWPLMPLAFAGLTLLLSQTVRLRGALLIGWLFGLGQFVLGLNWIATAFTFQAAMPHWYGWIAVVLLSAYLAVYPALATGLAWRFGRGSPLALALVLAGGWALTEVLRATLFTGFAWNPVGVTLDDTPWLNSARFVGTYGLSMLVVALGCGIAILSARAWKPAAILLVPTLLLLALPPAPIDEPLTNFAVTSLGRKAVQRTIRIVQPNIGQADKWREGLDEEAWARLTKLSLGGPSPRLLFWPEVAVPVPFQAAPSDARLLPIALPATARAARLLRPGDLLITGAFALVVDGEGRISGETNSVMPVDAQGRILGRYDKAHLVPYGEYLPMRPLLTALGLSQLAPGVGDTQPGPGPRTLNLGSWGKMGVQVCYEIIFSGQVVDRAHRPDFLFNPSNDAWFGRWGPPQHLAQARLRSAEEGIPIIRSTPTGISALVDAHGRLLRSLPWRTAGVIDAELPSPARPTLFSRFGNAIPLTIAVLLLMIGIGMDGLARYRRRI